MSDLETRLLMTSLLSATLQLSPDQQSLLVFLLINHFLKGIRFPGCPRSPLDRCLHSVMWIYLAEVVLVLGILWSQGVTEEWGDVERGVEMEMLLSGFYLSQHESAKRFLSVLSVICTTLTVVIQ